MVDTDRINFWLRWIACTIVIAGAVCTSLRLDPYNIWLLNLGAVVYLIWSIRIKESSLITINIALLLIYFIGLWV
jgi:hypothetical protein